MLASCLPTLAKDLTWWIILFWYLSFTILGVHEALIRTIGAFLTGRSQQVKIGSALSNSVIPRGGIPQGTRLAPLLFVILVNNLMKDWETRVKYVDDLSVLEIIPRCSTSLLPFIARDIVLMLVVMV